jgi:hypothetical protein
MSNEKRLSNRRKNWYEGRDCRFITFNTSFLHEQTSQKFHGSLIARGTDKLCGMKINTVVTGAPVTITIVYFLHYKPRRKLSWPCFLWVTSGERIRVWKEMLVELTLW